MAKDAEFPDGLLVKAPNPKAPDFVKATISIKVADLGKWLREKYKKGEEWINLDVKESKKGTWYASVSTFKPKEKEAPSKKPNRFSDMKDDDPADSIPF
jgi:hypothetical protein